MEQSLPTHKCTLVPSSFFNQDSARQTLSEVAGLEETDIVKSIAVPQYDAVLIYADEYNSGEGGALPELYYVLRDLPSRKEYNKIVCSLAGGWLHIGIAQGKTLLLANCYRAQNFTTAEYYIFLAVKSLQLNPEVSTISWRSPIGAEDEMSLYRYFKDVEKIWE